MTNITETDRDITRSYNAGTRDYDSITRSYRREREGVGTIGLDWLGRGCGEGWRGGERRAAGLVPSAWPSPLSFPHSSQPNLLSTPPSTSI